MEYTIVWGGDPEDVLIVTSGDASVADLLRTVQDGIDDPRFRDGLKVLFDHTLTRWWALSNEEIRLLADQLAAEAPRLGTHRVAAVVGGPLDEELAQMLRRLSDGRLPFDVHVFRSRDDARAWLRSAEPF